MGMDMDYSAASYTATDGHTTIEFTAYTIADQDSLYVTRDELRKITKAGWSRLESRSYNQQANAFYDRTDLTVGEPNVSTLTITLDHAVEAPEVPGDVFQLAHVVGSQVPGVIA